MSKIVSEPEAYFSHLVPPRNNLLVALEKEAQEHEIPIIGPVVGELLYLLATISNACRILELGTATGYSTIYLARACQPCDGKVVTVEHNADLAARAQSNLKKEGLSQNAEIHVRDALDFLAATDDTFDLIFLDIEKKDYVHTIPHLERILKKGGLLVADNVAFTEADTFNRTLAENPRWRVVNLLAYFPLHSPEKDGVCLALRE